MRHSIEQSLSVDDYEELGAALRVYDVDQRGWEHETKGPEANVNHVLKEMVRAKRKNMTDPSTIKGELAPDAVQFALRLRRWAELPIGLILPTDKDDTSVNAYAIMNNMGGNMTSSWTLAEIALADFTHQLDHVSERQAALDQAGNRLAGVSRYLLYFAEVSASELHFSLHTAFTDILANLRERFDIPEPVLSPPQTA